MDIDWLKDLKVNIPNYLDSLNKRDFKFLPVKSGLTQQGDMLSLGFSCYAIKIYYIINKWDNLSEKDKKTGLNISTPTKLNLKNFH